ncbi:hypothetical protein [Kineosporia babensis]|uniref:Uncharacterized protein n=1 Tax=Kineosporia babensis TaxID=499548 RepID=A0A9X1SYC6_9ACTN|nr:hypothetical protein [Kineosporia babensis]MCD5316210.1 hypothetical protein [Kineosporia babensis]
MTDDVLAVLRSEFDAEDESFLLAMRTDLSWNRAAFTRLEQALREVCAESVGAEELPRWLAEGFYELSHDVANWTAHPNFPRPEPESYYTDCLERLQDLADWFFRGWSAYPEDYNWPDL